MNLTNTERNLWSSLLHQKVNTIEIKIGYSNKLLGLCYDINQKFITCYPAKTIERFLSKIEERGGARNIAKNKWELIR